MSLLTILRRATRTQGYLGPKMKSSSSSSSKIGRSSATRRSSSAGSFEWWPSTFSRSFVSARGTSTKYAVLLMIRFLFGTPKRALRTGGLLAATVAGGLILSTLDRFGEGWPLYMLVFTTPVVLGVFGAVLLNRRNFLPIYRAGSPSRFVVRGEQIFVDLNGTFFRTELKDLRRIRRFWGLAVLDYRDERLLVVPFSVIPRRNQSQVRA